MRKNDSTPLDERYRINLARLREERKMTRDALAALMDCSDQYLYQLEAGIRSPSMIMVARTAKALKVDPSELLKETT